jgi:hypothetical protein
MRRLLEASQCLFFDPLSLCTQIATDASRAAKAGTFRHPSLMK